MSRNPSVRPLSIEEIEVVAGGFKDDLLREARRMVRRHNTTGANASLEGMEYIDEFVRALKLKAGSRVGFPARAWPIHLYKKSGGMS